MRQARLNKWFTILKSTAWLANGLALLGGLLYFLQARIYTHTQASLLDEGAYLLKGYLFASGKYWPYQDYGPWTNHMPLAFLIPGYAQVLFGPGLRTGRYLAVALSLLCLFGIWALGRRLGGRWWAALAVWAMALNPAVIKLYSLANSQALVACLLVWVFVLTLGERRAMWQIMTGAALAGFMVMTRENLAPVLLLLVLYVVWEHGWSAGLLAAAAGALPILVGHAVFWPNIMRIWAHWIPVDLLPFLKPFGHPAGSAPTWDPVVSMETRVVSFFHGLRFHFLALVGALSLVMLWPKREGWKSPGQFRLVVFLVTLMGLLVMFHMWAALGKDYCVFCYPVYLSFFTFIGFILVIVSFSAWRGDLPTWRQVVIGLGVLLLSTGVGFGAFSQLGESMLPLLDLQVPRMRAFRILPGSVWLGGLLQNRFGWTPVELEQAMRRLLPTLAGLLVGLALLIVAGLIARSINKGRPGWRISFGYVALMLVLGLGFFLTPTVVLGGGYRTYDCSGDVIAGYEAAGAHLADVIPARSLVYWRGGDSAVPLLYLKDVELFPAQINGDYSLRKAGNPDALQRYGFWSDPLAHQWAAQADFILIEERLFEGWLSELVEAGGYNELIPTSATMGCQDRTGIHIYRKRR